MVVSKSNHKLRVRLRLTRSLALSGSTKLAEVKSKGDHEHVSCLLLDAFRLYYKLASSAPSSDCVFA